VKIHIFVPIHSILQALSKCLMHVHVYVCIYN